MKKLFFAIAVFQFIAFTVCAQTTTRYKFSHFSSTYTPLPATGTLVIHSSAYDLSDWNYDALTSIPFAGFGYAVDTHVPMVNNYAVVQWPLLSLPSSQLLVRAVGAELVLASSTGNQIVQAMVTGTAPNRIMKIEYKNMNFYHESPTISSTISFQMWFYEADSSIEIHYGPFNYTAGNTISDRFYVSVLQCYSSSCTGYQLYGDPSNPTVDSSYMSTITFYTIPAEGTVYRFKPYTYVPSSVPTVAINDLSVNYNAFNKNLNITLPDNNKLQQAAIFDLSGRQMAAINSGGNNIHIDCSSFPASLYIVKIKTDNGFFVKKFVTQ